MILGFQHYLYFFLLGKDRLEVTFTQVNSFLENGGALQKNGAKKVVGGNKSIDVQ